MQQPVRRILGVDPGTRVAGWGVLECAGNVSKLLACGVVRTKGPSMEVRLREVRDGLADVMRTYTPAAVAIERPFFGKSASSALTVGMARGVALLVAADSGVQVYEYAPAVVKKAVVGNGNAAKEQVAAMVQVILGVRELGVAADATDALAVALAHAHRATHEAGVHPALAAARKPRRNRRAVPGFAVPPRVRRGAAGGAGAAVRGSGP